jgi:hypothetical protein
VGHWARECPDRKPEKEAHLVVVDSDDDKHTLMMAEYCALQGEAGEAETEQGFAVLAVDLDEPRV